MPIYDYKCKTCGGITEVFQRSGSQKVVTCSHCGSEVMEKMISAPGAILKERTVDRKSTCCGRKEKCEAPPCSSGGSCRREN